MFESFELEGDRNCRYDNVSLYAGPSKSDFLATYCGKRKFIEPLISDRGMMRVIFVSDKVNTEKLVAAEERLSLIQIMRKYWHFHTLL